MNLLFNFFSQQLRFGSRRHTSSPQWLARFLHNQEGSVIVYLTIAMPVLIGIAALAAEGGFWMYQKRLLQAAADNAAYSAAAAYAANTSSDITTQARAITANDYNLVNGQNNVTVAVNRPPTGGCYTSTSNYTGANAIEVIVTKPQTPLLSGIWLTNNVNICGRGVAIVPDLGDCILALGSDNTKPGISNIGNKINNLAINLTNCGIFSDSTNSNSISLTGNNNTINAYSVGTTGGISVDGNTKSGISNGISGVPSPVPDPYQSDAASLWVPSQTPAPTVTQSCASCTVLSSATIPTCAKQGPTTITLPAGTYPAGKPDLSNCVTVIMNAGTYVFPSGFTIPSSATLTIASGVTIIVQAGGWNNSGVVQFGSGNYSIYIAAGGWTSGTTAFGSGNYQISVVGNWTIGATTFGNGNYTFALTGDLNSGALTMGTGTYSGSMANWNLTDNTTVGSGIYYLSGNLNLTGNASNNETVTANGVTFVLTGATSVINSTGNHQTWTVTPPTTGWNAGLAIWEPNSTGSNQIATGNNSTATFTGLLYAPKADMQYVGNSGSTPVCTQIVTNTIEFGGNSINITGTCPGVPGLKTFGQVAALVE
jgi:Flp pilus assembly protein TadG